MNPELATTVLPSLIWFAIIIGFLAAITVGLAIGLSLFFFQATTSSLKKFNANMDEAQAAFAKLNASTQQQLLSQVRAAEVWRRDRKEQLDEQTAGAENGRDYPSYTQDWRKGA